MTLETPYRAVLEEQLDYGSVTDSREAFLKIVDALDSEPMKRHIVTKHGTPRAVLMSYRAYQLLMKVAAKALAESQRKGGDRAQIAMKEMAAEHWPDAPESAQVVIGNVARARAAIAAAAADAAAPDLSNLTILTDEDIKRLIKAAVKEGSTPQSEESEAEERRFPGVRVNFYKKALSGKRDKGSKTLKLKHGFLVVHEK